MAREPISTSDQAVAFLMSLVRDDPHPYQARAGLAQAPVRALLARLGDPHVDLPVVHIAGSKGKGSTALYLEAILNAAGLSTGTFTSPHLQRWTERYRVDGLESTAPEFAALFAHLQPHVLDLLEEDSSSAPSFFDVLTAAAFVLFAETRVDCAIIETGIGGRLDATNVVQPMLACITSVELEHTDKLGTSIAAIAGEKAGIIKKGVPLVIGPLPGEAESVIRHRARSLATTVSALEQEIALDTHAGPGGGLVIQVLDDHREYRAMLPGPVSDCNARNAALAIACAHRVAGGDEETVAGSGYTRTRRDPPARAHGGCRRASVGGHRRRPYTRLDPGAGRDAEMSAGAENASGRFPDRSQRRRRRAGATAGARTQGRDHQCGRDPLAGQPTRGCRSDQPWIPCIPRDCNA